jgi:hypothetical protein
MLQPEAFTLNALSNGGLSVPVETTADPLVNLSAPVPGPASWDPLVSSLPLAVPGTLDDVNSPAAFAGSVHTARDTALRIHAVALSAIGAM